MLMAEELNDLQKLYVASLKDDYDTEARRTQRNLMVASFILIAAGALGVNLCDLSIFNLKQPQPASPWIAKGIALLILTYFSVKYAASRGLTKEDLRSRRKRYRDDLESLQNALKKKIGQRDKQLPTNATPKQRDDAISRDTARLSSEVKFVQNLASRLFWVRVRRIEFYWVPPILAVAAVASLFIFIESGCSR